MGLLSVLVVCGLCAVGFASEASRNHFTVHEWGTYTSMQGSDGVGQRGLHHGEEALPTFVKSRGSGFEMDALKSAGNRKLQGIIPPTFEPKDISDCLWCDQVDFDPAQGGKLAVTQKLETPVLYFYSPKAVDVQVDVAFPKGLVTEVYPAMSAFSPAFKQVEAVANGTAQWRVRVHEPQHTVIVPEVETESIWIPSRRVSANMVTNQQTQEHEHHIFYRGLGQFASELTVTTTLKNLTIHNTQAEDVESVFVLESDGVNGGVIRALGGVRGGQSLTIPLQGAHLGEDFLENSLYITRAVVLLEAALMKAGLFPLEARAMVDTWTKSYFKNSGLRVLYVAPRRWTEALLPIRVAPKPDFLERVLVGRVEVQTKAQEEEMVKGLKTIPATADYATVRRILNDVVRVPALLRFGEPKLRRAMSLAGLSAPVVALCEEYILRALTA